MNGLGRECRTIVMLRRRGECRRMKSVILPIAIYNWTFDQETLIYEETFSANATQSHSPTHKEPEIRVLVDCMSTIEKLIT